MKISKYKSIQIITFLMALLLFLVACANKGVETETSEPVESVSETESTEAATEPVSEAVTSTEKNDENQRKEIYVSDFTLSDQNGVEHTLSDYLGKKVIINFWASWCGPCKAELPFLQDYFVEQGSNEEDVILLGVANPSDDPLSQELDKDGLAEFIEDNGLGYPTLMDYEGFVFGSYGISAFPTTVFINSDGTLVGYYPGMLNHEVMDSAMSQFK